MMHRGRLASVWTGFFSTENYFPYFMSSPCPDKKIKWSSLTHLHVEIFCWKHDAMELALENVSGADLSIDFLYDFSKSFQLCVSIFKLVIRRQYQFLPSLLCFVLFTALAEDTFFSVLLLFLQMDAFTEDEACRLSFQKTLKLVCS